MCNNILISLQIDFATFIDLSEERLKTIIPVTLGDLHATQRFCSDALKKKINKKQDVHH